MLPIYISLNWTNGNSIALVYKLFRILFKSHVHEDSCFNPTTTYKHRVRLYKKALLTIPLSYLTHPFLSRSLFYKEEEEEASTPYGRVLNTTL